MDRVLDAGVCLELELVQVALVAGQADQAGIPNNNDDCEALIQRELCQTGDQGCVLEGWPTPQNSW